MTDLTLYHNPRCSKSRAALALLQERGLQPQIVLYLDNPPSTADLRALLQRLGLPARELLRTGEEAYQQLQLADPSVPEASLLEAMHNHPKLIERPILVAGERAVIGRPPERVLEILP